MWFHAARCRPTAAGASTAAPTSSTEKQPNGHANLVLVPASAAWPADAACVIQRTSPFLPSLFIFCLQGMIRCEVISQGSACVTCAGLWAKTSQTRASVFEHNRDIAGVRFELRCSFSRLLTPPCHLITQLASSLHAAAPATIAPRHMKRAFCAPFCCLSVCLLPCDAFWPSRFVSLVFNFPLLTAVAARLECYSRAALW